MSIRYLDGSSIANAIMQTKVYPSDGNVTLAVMGSGPFLRQIQKMADGTSIEVGELNTKYYDLPDLDVTEPLNIARFFSYCYRNLSDAPCAVEAIGRVMATAVARGAAKAGITVIGRGRVGAFTAVHAARCYGRVLWQSALDPIQDPGLMINCDSVELDYPDGSVVIDVKRLGRLTTAILLSRTIEHGGGQITIYREG